ncbi:MAG: NTP transferase domain-containing protein [Isosphaeraceae bacterium]
MTIAAVILCGGESRRMGRPKAWLPFAGELMLQRVVRLISTVADPLVVGPHPSRCCRRSSIAVARDLVRGRGPLQGSPPGSGHSRAGRPLLRFRHRRPLLQARVGGTSPRRSATTTWPSPAATAGITRSRRLPPAVAIPAIDALLGEDRLRPVFLMDRLRTREVSEAEPRGGSLELSTLCNLNTPDDYRSALEHIAPVAEGTGVAADSAAATRPTVVVELFGVPRLRAGVGQVRLEAGSVGEALRGLGLACPALVGSVLTAEATLRPAYMLSLNGRNFVSDHATPLADGDALILLAVEAGG